MNSYFLVLLLCGLAVVSTSCGRQDSSPGRDGIDGSPGIDGVNGTPGRDGGNGGTGPQGAPGTDGENGQTGQTGPQGPSGPTGAPTPVIITLTRVSHGTYVINCSHVCNVVVVDKQKGKNPEEKKHD